jgi:hypothetical protein
MLTTILLQLLLLFLLNNNIVQTVDITIYNTIHLKIAVRKKKQSTRQNALKTSSIHNFCFRNIPSR